MNAKKRRRETQQKTNPIHVNIRTFRYGDCHEMLMWINIIIATYYK